MKISLSSFFNWTGQGYISKLKIANLKIIDKMQCCTFYDLIKEGIVQ